MSTEVSAELSSGERLLLVLPRSLDGLTDRDWAFIVGRGPRELRGYRPFTDRTKPAAVHWTSCATCGQPSHPERACSEQALEWVRINGTTFPTCRDCGASGNEVDVRRINGEWYCRDDESRRVAASLVDEPPDGPPAPGPVPVEVPAVEPELAAVTDLPARTGSTRERINGGSKANKVASGSSRKQSRAWKLPATDDPPMDWEEFDQIAADRKAKIDGGERPGNVPWPDRAVGFVLRITAEHGSSWVSERTGISTSSIWGWAVRAGIDPAGRVVRGKKADNFPTATEGDGATINDPLTVDEGENLQPYEPGVTTADEPQVSESYDSPTSDIGLNGHRRRKWRTTEEKLTIVAFAKEHGYPAAAEKFGCNDATIRAWAAGKQLALPGTAGLIGKHSGEVAASTPPPIEPLEPEEEFRERIESKPVVLVEDAPAPVPVRHRVTVPFATSKSIRATCTCGWEGERGAAAYVEALGYEHEQAHKATPKSPEDLDDVCLCGKVIQVHLDAGLSESERALARRRALNDHLDESPGCREMIMGIAPVVSVEPEVDEQADADARADESQMEFVVRMGGKVGTANGRDGA